jgi:kumamolisin
VRARPVLAATSAVGIVCCSLAAAAPAHAATAARAGRAVHVDVADGSPLQLTADVIPNLAELVPTGPAPANQRMQVIVGITNPNHAAAVSYLDEISDPSSPLYRHFLTPSQYGTQFGVSADETSDAESRLATAGLRIDAVSAGGDAITATGTVAQVEKAFSVSEDSYASNGHDFIANTAGPTVWSADNVFTVVGLNTLDSYAVPTVPAATRASGTSTDPLPIDTTIFDLYKLYNQPAAYTGQGQGLTVIGEGDPSIPLADLRQFETTYGLPTVPVTVNCVDKDANGTADCGTDTSGNGEWDIDFQASTGMAPNVTGLTLDFSQSLGDSDLDNAFLKWINDPNGTRQASASEGVCEETPLNPVVDGNTPVNSNQTEGTGEALGDDQEPVIDGGLLQAAIEGRTLFASTGDTGDTCGAIVVGPIGAGNGVIYNGAPESVDYPAASAYATAVGGTEIYPDETDADSADCTTDTGTAGTASTPASYGTSTAAYPACTEDAWPYSGGGTSQYIAEGDYAATDGVLKTPCISSPDGTTGNTGKNCRSTPDVAAQSGGLLDGMDIISGGAASTAAGTSLAAPLWQGIWARIQSSAPTASGFGFADETIYKLATNATTYARDFHDITVGANPLPATTGYDNTTGWGTPNVANFIADADAEGAQTVSASVPEAPLALLVPVAGAIALGGGTLLRRRRRREI